MFNKKNTKRFAIVYRVCGEFAIKNGIYSDTERVAMVDNDNVQIYAIRELEN